MNNELIRITENDGVQTVSGRELHKALGINSNYTTWFSRMCKYGFKEDRDYITCFPNLESELHGGQNMIDHIVKLDMAKHICMVQNSPIGTEIREYFIRMENKARELSKDEDYLLAQGMLIAGKKIERLKAENTALMVKVEEQNKQIAEMQPKASYVDTILQSKDLVPTRLIAKDYGLSAERLNTILRDAGIQYKDGGRWYLYQKYAEMNLGQSKTFRVLGKDGEIQYKPWLCWTQSGRFFINDLLKSMNILPVVERPKQISLSEYNWGEYWS